MSLITERSYKILTDFSGGLNNASSPSNIKDNELSYIYNLDIAEDGVLRSMGLPASLGTLYASLADPAELFVFKSDYDFDSPPNPAITESLVVGIGNKVAFFDPAYALAKEFTCFTNTAGSFMFLAEDGILRVGDAGHRPWNQNVWIGYINRIHFPGTQEDEFADWHMEDAAIVPPEYAITILNAGMVDDGGGSSTTIHNTGAFADIKGVINTAATDGNHFLVRDIGGSGGAFDKCAKILSATDDVLTTADLGDGDSWAGVGYRIHPPQGKGVVLGIDDTVAVTGTWTGNYEFAVTYIYDGNQESLPLKFTGETFSPSNDKLYTHIYMTNGGGTAANGYLPRLTGGRIYYREVGDRDWLLYLDYSFDSGAKFTGETDFTDWTYAGTGYSSIGGAPLECYFWWYGIIADPPVDATFESINEFSQDTETINADYGTATILGRRSFIAIIKQSELGTNEVLYDRIMYSPPNKFDTYPVENYIDIGINDGDRFVRLVGYGSKLLAFKEKKLYIINMESGNAYNWFLEGEFSQRGISDPTWVVSTEYGIVFINKNGCFLFNGSEIISLIHREGRRLISQSTWNTFITSTSSVGYDPKTKKLFVIKGRELTAGSFYVYNMDLMAWAQGNKFAISTGDRLSTFAILSDRMVFARYIDAVYPNASLVLYEWSDTPTASTGQEARTKNFVFESPSYYKKLYSISLYGGSIGTITSTDLIKISTSGGYSYSSGILETKTVALGAGYDAYGSSRVKCTAFTEFISLLVSIQLTTGQRIKLDSLEIEYRPIEKRV